MVSRALCGVSKYGKIMNPNDILQPILGMVFLHAIVLAWMILVRKKAMSEMSMTMEDAKHLIDFNVHPAYARQVADNYNHLFELPTIFYAIIFYVWAIGHVDAIHIWCAWAFFISRIIHSLIQGVFNNVKARFSVFIFGWVTILIMAFRELLRAII
ncbi:MAG: hypothetical protein ACI9WC_001152 [Arenicella sp.]|jgi:hypothetical protein